MRWRYHYPQAAFPYARPACGERARAARTTPSSSWSTPGVFDDDRYWADHRRLRQGRRRRDICMRIARPQRRARRRDAARAADAVVPQHLVLGRRRRRGRRSARRTRRARMRRRRTRRLGRWRSRGPDPAGDAPDAALLRERDQRRAAVASPAQTAVPEGRHQRPRGRTAPTTVNPDAARHQGGAGTALDVAARRDRRAPPAAGAAPTGDVARPRQRTSTATSPTRAREADEFFAELTPARRDAPTRRGACARPSPG